MRVSGLTTIMPCRITDDTVLKTFQNSTLLLVHCSYQEAHMYISFFKSPYICETVVYLVLKPTSTCLAWGATTVRHLKLEIFCTT